MRLNANTRFAASSPLPSYRVRFRVMTMKFSCDDIGRSFRIMYERSGFIRRVCLQRWHSTPARAVGDVFYGIVVYSKMREHGCTAFGV